MSNKGFKKVYSAPGYPIDPKLEMDRQNAIQEQPFVPIFRAIATDKELSRINKRLLLQTN